MAFFRSLKQSFNNLQDILRKRRQSPSSSPCRRECGRDNSDNNPCSNSSPTSSPLRPGQDLALLQHTSTSVDQALGGRRQAGPSARPRTAGGSDDLRAEQDPRPAVPADRVARSVQFPSSDGLESDSEPDDRGVSRCQCSRKLPISSSSISDDDGGKLSTAFAEEIYGETDSGSARSFLSSGRRDKSLPSTSRGMAELGAELSGEGAAAGTTTTERGVSSSCCSSLQDRLMEEMVTALKTHGSLSGSGGSRQRRGRSRSRSRRSRPRQGHESGVVVTHVRTIHALPRRETTDSDDSNTSLHDLPLTLTLPLRQRCAGQPSSSSACLQSDSSFHSVAATTPPPPQASSSSTGTKMGEEEEDGWRGREEEEEEWGVGVNSTEHNRSRGRDDEEEEEEEEGQARRQRQRMEELSSYGPEEFVLDLLLAMCRGTWSDIL